MEQARLFMTKRLEREGGERGGREERKSAQTLIAYVHPREAEPQTASTKTIQAELFTVRIACSVTPPPPFFNFFFYENVYNYFARRME